MQFTVENLRRILESSSGMAEDLDWASPQALETPFSEFGYDSLALLEFVGRVQLEYGVEMPDDAVVVITSPAAALRYINQRLDADSRSR
jgi:act minimal PKS acyl carrier protein